MGCFVLWLHAILPAAALHHRNARAVMRLLRPQEMQPRGVSFFFLVRDTELGFIQSSILFDVMLHRMHFGARRETIFRPLTPRTTPPTRCRWSETMLCARVKMPSTQSFCLLLAFVSFDSVWFYRCIATLLFYFLHYLSVSDCPSPCMKMESYQSIDMNL